MTTPTNYCLSGTLDTLLSETSFVPGVVAAVADRNGLLYAGAAGVRDTDTGIAMDTKTIIAIASMTKAITTTALLQLVEQGLVLLDAPVADYLPQLANLQVLDGFDSAEKMRLISPEKAPTVRQLLTHTSGYVYEIWNEDALKTVTTGQVDSLFVEGGTGLLAPLGFTPGSRWEYGIGIDIAGQVIEAVSGEALDLYFLTHIFDPLGMEDTFYSVPEEKKNREASIHIHADGYFSPIPPLSESISGGGGLHSTVHDYVRFMRVMLNSGILGGVKILEPATVDSMFANQIGDLSVGPGTTQMPEFSNDFDMGFGAPAKWGLGFLLHPDGTPAGRPSGSGSWAGLFNSYFWIDRERGLCAVIATQLLPFYDAGAIELLKSFEELVYSSTKG
tara:strand:- start:458 stop:1624 length:1167 start_codon:yes stop_codon:yes gene_type:complete